MLPGGLPEKLAGEAAGGLCGPEAHLLAPVLSAVVLWMLRPQRLQAGRPARNIPNKSLGNIMGLRRQVILQCACRGSLCMMAPPASLD